MSNTIGHMEVDDVEPSETLFKINETSQLDKHMNMENLIKRIELVKLIRNS